VGIKRSRITIPDAIQKIEEQTKGVITSDSFYPIPCTFPISDFLNAYKSKPHVEFTCHPHCGAATYLYIENGGVVLITKLGDVDKFFTDLSLVTEDLRRGQDLKAKLRVGLSALSNKA